MINKRYTKKKESIDLLTLLIKKGCIKEMISPSGTAENFILFATLSELGFKFKYYPIVTKKLKCMMVLK